MHLINFVGKYEVPWDLGLRVPYSPSHGKISFTYSVKHFTMEAISLVLILAIILASLSYIYDIKASPLSSLNLAFQFSVPEAGNLKCSYV